MMTSILYEMKNDGNYSLSNGSIPGKCSEIGVILDTERWVIVAHGSGMAMLFKHLKDMEDYKISSTLELHKRTALFFGKIPVKDINTLLLSKDRDNIKNFAEKYGLFPGINVSLTEKEKPPWSLDDVDHTL